MDGSAKSTLGKFFWTTRNPKNKPRWPKPEDSTGDIYPGILLGRKSCWEAQGPARETFLILASEIKAYLNSQSDPVPSPVTWTMYMIGSTRESSRPTVMFCSADKSARKTIKERIDKSGLLDKYPGFDTGGCSQEFRRFATENEAGALNSESTMEDTMEEKNIFYSRSEIGPGMYVYIQSAYKSSTLRRTRCGGIVYNHGRCFLQTVAHAFTENENTRDLATSQEESCEFEFELEDHNDTDNEDEDVEMSSRGSATPEYVESDDAAMSVSSSYVSTVSWSLTGTPGQSQQGAGVDHHSSSAVPSMLEKIDPKSLLSSSFGSSESLASLGSSIILSTSGAQPDLDYCLIEIPPSELIYFDNFLKNRCPSQTVLSPKFIAREEPATATVTITRMDDPFNGTLSGTPTFMMLPGYVSVQEIWAVRHSGILVNGDCGSWIVDASNGALYGHIVAGDPRLQTAYIIPAYLIFDDLRNRFGGEWCLSKTDQALEHCSSPGNNSRVDEHDPNSSCPLSGCRVTEPVSSSHSSEHQDLHKPFSLTSQGFDILWENYQEDQNNIPAIETHGKESLGRNLVSVSKLKHISAPVLDAKGDHVDAEKVMRDLQETFKQDYHEIIATDLDLAIMLQHSGKLREAEELLNIASEKLERKYCKNKDFMVARLKTIQGEVFQKQGRYELAEKTYREALECDQGLLGSETETSLQLRTSFALCLLHQNKLQEAETMFKEFAVVCKRRLGEGHLATKRTLRWLADAPHYFIAGSIPIPKKPTAIFSSTLDNSLDKITRKR
jgi:hypothetical protein